MIPTLTLIIAAYVITRMIELVANEERSGEAKRTALQVIAVVTMLVTIGSCAMVQLTGGSIPTP